MKSSLKQPQDTESQINNNRKLLNSRLIVVCGIMVVSLSLLSLIVHAAPVNGDITMVIQPDGQQVTIRVWGDEFYSIAESLDGFTLTHDPDTGFICYARLSTDKNQLISTGIPVGQTPPKDLKQHLRINTQTSAAQIQAGHKNVENQNRNGGVALTIGNIQGVCAPVDFPDQIGTITQAQINDFCNQIGYSGFGNQGSVRDYFFDVSNGRFTYANLVPNYYRTQSNIGVYNVAGGVPTLIREVLSDLDNQRFNFASCDFDHNGIVDAFTCLYAGDVPGGWGTPLWPRYNALNPPFTTWDGVQVADYALVNMGPSLTLRTFCHENGHMLGHWPDLYDYGNDGVKSAGLGNFCIMSYGASNTNPCQPCAYLKDIAGWATTNILTTPQVSFSVPSTGNIVYKYPNPANSNECYLIENRQRIGRDANIPDGGLAIWHIDTLGSNEHQQQTGALHYLVTLVQADGQWDLEHANLNLPNPPNLGDTTDLWKAPTYTQCNPSTTPNTNWWDGTSSNLYIQNIGSSGLTMTFDFIPFTWVDFNYHGIEDGSFNQPFNSLFEGVNAVSTGGTVMVKASSSSETITISKPLILKSYGGTTCFNHHVSLTNLGFIKLSNNGCFKIY